MLRDVLESSPALLLRTASGELTSSDIHYAMKNWRTHPCFDPATPVLWDVRGSVFASTVTQVLRSRNTNVQTNPGKRRTGRTAWVADSVEVFALIRQLSRLVKWDTEWDMFEDLDAAREWLLSAPGEVVAAREGAARPPGAPVPGNLAGPAAAEHLGA